MSKPVVIALTVLAGLGSASNAFAFCGFYVARAGTSLFNKASQIVLVRDGDWTVITMSSDCRGTLREFAVVIPLPTSITREQIHIADQALICHLDAYTAPRLVEYYDRGSLRAARAVVCDASLTLGDLGDGLAASPGPFNALGVTIEAESTVGDYDIVILSAAQSTGLETWLRESGYRIPTGAYGVLGSYIRQNMRFFVAKVNLAEQTKLGYATLRPIQVAGLGATFQVGATRALFDVSRIASNRFGYDVSPDGRRFLVNLRVDSPSSGVVLVVNWPGLPKN